MLSGESFFFNYSGLIYNFKRRNQGVFTFCSNADITAYICFSVDIKEALYLQFNRNLDRVV